MGGDLDDGLLARAAPRPAEKCSRRGDLGDPGARPGDPPPSIKTFILLT